MVYPPVSTLFHQTGISTVAGPGAKFIGISGGFTIGNNFEGELPQIGNSYQISENITKVIGKHTTKFGIDLRDQRFLQTLYFDVSGDYSYFGGGLNDPIALDANGNQNLFPNYLFGLPDSYLQGSAQTEDVRGKGHNRPNQFQNAAHCDPDDLEWQQ